MSVKPPAPAILTVQEVTRSYGAQPVLDGVSLTLHEGERVGLIGRNGSGKSTLLRIMAGLDTPDSGLLTRMQGLRVGLLTQDCELPGEWTVAEALEKAGAPARELLAHYHRLLAKLGEHRPGTKEHAQLQQKAAEAEHGVSLLDGWDLPTEIKRLSTELALPSEERRLNTLSGGELRRVDLARNLMERPDLLLLDEPTNHIDTRSVEWVERYLERYRGACVLVTHDRYFLERVVSRIVEIEFSRVYSFSGNYAELLEYKAAIEETQQRTESNRLSAIRRELAWYQRGAKARTTKQKARIQRLDALQGEGPPPRHREFEFEIPQPERLMKTVLNARDIRHGYDDTRLIDGFSVIMQKGMRVGILGPNGCGKTTLLRILMGREEPDRGRIVIGDATQFLYVDQSHEEVTPGQTVLDFVSGGQRHWDVGQKRIYVPAYLERFLFDKASVQMPMSNLSGGERNRLDLARKLLRGGNFLVLDEPTNDLDLYTLRILEEAILDFDGCALIVSHDRYFLNRVCTHMWVFEDSGNIVQLTGNYDDYLLYRGKQAEIAASRRRTAAESRRQETAEKPRSGPRRLTYLEKKELESMEAQILATEEEVAALERAVADPAFYQRDGAHIRGVLQELEGAKAQVEALYARWEDLEGRA